MPDPIQHGWHGRGYLPHLDFRKATQGVTFRLADSLPAKVVARLKAKLAEEDASAELRAKIAAYEDRGYGECLLRDPENAALVEEQLRYFDGKRYELLEWVIMPNHVHVLVRPHSAMVEQIVQTWKRVSARKINERMGRRGAVWARDYFDRVIRDEVHRVKARRYIRHNPVKAGLCREPADWRWSSAWEERRL